jgi:hypothetical protein
MQETSVKKVARREKNTSLVRVRRRWWENNKMNLGEIE